MKTTMGTGVCGTIPEAEADRSLSSRPAWSTKQVVGQPRATQRNPDSKKQDQPNQKKRLKQQKH